MYEAEAEKKCALCVWYLGLFVVCALHIEPSFLVLPVELIHHSLGFICVDVVDALTAYYSSQAFHPWNV